VRGIDESTEHEGAIRGDFHRPGDGSAGRIQLLCDYRRRRGSERVLGETAGDLRGASVEVQQQRCGCRKRIVGVEHAERDGVGLAVAEQGRERREVHAIGNEVQRLHAGDGEPEEGIDAAGENPGEDGRDSGGLAIDGNFSFTEGGVAAAEQFARDIVGHAGVPELVVGLALREDVEIRVLDVRRKCEGAGERAGGGVEGDGASSGPGGERQNCVGGSRRSLAVGEREEFKLSAGEDDAGQTVLTHDVADVSRALLSDHEDRAVVGEIALHVPGGAESGRGLGGSAEIDVRGSQPEVGGAVELDTGGYADVGGEYNLRPRSGAVRRGRVGEGIGSEVRELGVIQERHNTGLGRRAGNVGVRGHGIAGADDVGS